MKKIKKILSRWNLPQYSDIKLINHAQNLIYTVDNTYILRQHDIDYHSKEEIISELQWLNALGNDSELIIPNAIIGVNGEYVQHIIDDEKDYYFTLFDYIDGQHITIDDTDISRYFYNLGKLSATTHQHVLSWQRPADFTRKSWHEENLFGKNALWGDWRHAPNLSAQDQKICEEAEIMLRQKLYDYGKHQYNFGLIHGDMRFANLLMTNDGLALIDFDDCGDGWFMYDFATSISFMELRHDIAMLKQSWLNGYQTIRALRNDDIDILDDMIMARRLALLAWVSNNHNATEPKQLAPYFAYETALLAQRYLKS